MLAAYGESLKNLAIGGQDPMDHPETETAAAAIQVDSLAQEDIVSVPIAGQAISSAPVRYRPSGRRLYDFNELSPEVRLRVEHYGKWVAWSPDGSTIVASSESLKDLFNAPERQQTPGTILEWLGD